MQGANESRCLHDGTWSSPPPMCKGIRPYLDRQTENKGPHIIVFQGSNICVYLEAEKTCFVVFMLLFYVLSAVYCPLPKPPKDGRIVHEKTLTGNTVMYGQKWTYECNPPKAPSHEEGSCMADGTSTEPPVCRGNETFFH